MCFKSESLLSDVDVMLSQVHLLFSEINQKVSSSPVLVQSQMLLPRIEVVLSEISWLVSLSQPQNVVKDEELESLGWDHNYDYYNPHTKIV